MTLMILRLVSLILTAFSQETQTHWDVLAGNMQSRNPQIQRNQVGRCFRGARAIVAGE
jgi:hypothetical protein